MDKLTDLLIATYNQGKLRELASLLSNIPITLKNLGDLTAVTEIEETGATFHENAELKASGYAVQSGFWSLADDSGLEVKALSGAPGVYSNRFAGEGASDAARMEKVLNELKSTRDASRDARFVCVMSIADSTGKIVFTAEGICNGTIARAPRGDNGFGYDPIFIPNGFDRTFGELPGRIKQQISHRARAVAEIIRYLQGFFKL
ncbi:MAG TPA: RdgB/HAM1 family non-canonical purine NTP pyrophosphatase [Pyrinomonadaceae bacterium]|nr:RdgB/HAM1 family non-canonical purine NTP pyrophosphatase [Pyrinomonadaceae bacterium]